MNGGKNDIVTPLGWLEAPADRAAGIGSRQEFDLVSVGYIYVLDVNGDGRNDLVTSMAHDYGLFWMENLGGGKWLKHVIDDTWSQGHALTMVDLNGDGRPDFVTGKRYMAHNGSDPGEREPLGIYWYEYRPAKDGSIEWVKHIIDYGGRVSAGACETGVADLDGDGQTRSRHGGARWTFHSVPRPAKRCTGPQASSWKNQPGVNVWTFFTADTERGILYMPFGSANNDF